MKWIKCGLPYGPIYNKDWIKTGKSGDSFVERKLNIPGTVIKMSNGKTYLIGHINSLRGVCDDCTAFIDTEIVKEYIVLDIPK